MYTTKTYRKPKEYTPSPPPPPIYSVYRISILSYASPRLDLVPRGNVHRLDVVLELHDDVLDVIRRELVVLDDDHHLELLDAEGDGLELVGPPEKAVALDRAVLEHQRLEVDRVVPRLDVDHDVRLGDDGRLLRLRGLLLLLLVVEGGLLLLGHVAEEVDVVVVGRLGRLLLRGLGLLGGRLVGLRDLRALAGEVGRHAGDPLDRRGVRAEHLLEEAVVGAGRRVALDVRLARELLVEFAERHWGCGKAEIGDIMVDCSRK